MNTPFTFRSLLTKHRVSIPMLQRDYAQGRPDADTATKRRAFVAALRRAFGPAPADQTQSPLGLDFVYGTVEDDGRLVPLDGQQRLTTLWLLHWYLAARAGRELSSLLNRFSYDSRVSARDFGQALVASCQSLDSLEADRLAPHLANQPWFQLAWHRDATVRGMLTMADEIHRQFADVNAPAALDALLTEDAFAAPITFEFLNLGEHHLSDRLYTRMNARGKALTPFENWKAQLDELLQKHHPNQAKAFTDKLDGAWTDCFWRNADPTVKKQHGDPALLVDAPMLAFFDFVTRMLRLRDFPTDCKATDVDATGSVPFAWYEEVYGTAQMSQERGTTNLAFLMQVLEALSIFPELQSLFGCYFTTSAPTLPSARALTVRIFTGWREVAKDSEALNLFLRCCQPGLNPNALERLLFFSFLRLHTVPNERVYEKLRPDRLLRYVRNLLLGNRNHDQFRYYLDLPVDQLPQQLRFIERLIQASANTSVEQALLNSKPTTRDGFRQETIDHELAKAQLVQAGQVSELALNRLEDMPELRGNCANVLNAHAPADLERVVEAMQEIWSETQPVDDRLIIRAWLTVGDYSVPVDSWDTRWFFGGRDHEGVSRWNAVLTTINPTVSESLAILLSRYAAAPGATATDKLKAVVAAFEPGPEREEWQKHFVRYPEMLTERGQAFFFWDDEGVERVRLLSKDRMSAYHINPYVRAVAMTLDNHICRVEQCFALGWDFGPLRYEKLHGVPNLHLYCEGPGWRLTMPATHQPSAALRAQYQLEVDPNGKGWRLPHEPGTDRVARAVTFSQALAEAGALIPANAPT